MTDPQIELQVGKTGFFCGIICLQQYLPPPPLTGSALKLEWRSATREKERGEYEKWKTERDRIDQERLQRTKDDMGCWKREWDQHKPLNR